MLKDIMLLDVKLDLFDGEGGGEGGGAANAQAPADSGAGEQPAPAEASPTPEEQARQRRAAWREMIRGEYRDLYAEDTQRLIDRRFRETQSLREQLDKTRPVIDTLMQRYGIAGGDIARLSLALDNDNVYWTAAAEEAGMDVQQFKAMRKLEAENAAFRAAQERAQAQAQVDAQAQAWIQAAEAVKQTYPDFDLRKEAENPEFVSMLRAGVPMEHAYWVMHREELVDNMMKTTAADAEKRVTDNIRAKGARPAENGAADTAAFTTRQDVNKMSNDEILDVLKRVGNGERISFG